MNNFTRSELELIKKLIEQDTDVLTKILKILLAACDIEINLSDITLHKSIIKKIENEFEMGIL